jgi:hypothetical protein
VTGAATHRAPDRDGMLAGYEYDILGQGVRADLVTAVLGRWANCDPHGDPAGPLRAVNRSPVSRVENLARMAALSVALILEEGPR